MAVAAPAQAITHAGVAVQAADTGRILMIQRALDPTDPPEVQGTWEFPGGSVEDGETPEQGAWREFHEETGLPKPDGETVATWTAPNGIYRGHVHVVPVEADAFAELNPDRQAAATVNPDDPKRENPDVTAWFDPEHARQLGPALRPEVADMDWSVFDHGTTATESWRSLMSETLEIQEAAGSLSEAAAGGRTPGVDGIWPVQIISAGWGSSGYYSPDVLKEAADKNLIQAGTPAFFDHSSATERHDRPERSVRDIGAVFTRPPTYDAAKKRLIGEVQVLKPYRDLVSELAPHIGLSISGAATDITHGEAEGRRGPIVEGLAHINSVDMVTKAGRGGKFLTSLMESARTTAPDEPVLTAFADGPLLESYSQLLEAGGQAAHPGDTERLMRYWAEGEGAAKIGWGSDGDFYRCEANLGKYVNPEEVKGLCSNLHKRATGARPGHAPGESHESASSTTSSTTSGTPVSETTRVPAARPGETKKGATMPKIEIEESEHVRLTETAGRVTALEADKRTWEAERSTLTADLSKVQGELTEARAALIPNKDLREAIANLTQENAMLRAREVAAPLIAESLEDALIGESAKTRLAGELIDGIALKESEVDGTVVKVLDTAALTEAINAKVRVAEAEAQELREALGVGKVRGLGQSTGGGLLVEQKLTESTSKIAGALSKTFGLSEAAAKTAAQGR